MFGLFTSSFERQMRRLAAETGLAVSDIDENSALFRHPHKYSGYFVCVGVLRDGSVLLSCLSHSKWAGRVPAAAHVLMEDFDKKSERVSYLLRTNDEGVSRCAAASKFRSLNSLTSDAFSELAAEMIVKVAHADQLFREHGYA